MELRKTYSINVDMEDGSQKTIRMYDKPSKQEQQEISALASAYENYLKELGDVTTKLHEVEKQIALIAEDKTKVKELKKLTDQRDKLISFNTDAGMELLEELAKKRFEISILPSTEKDEILSVLDGSGLFADFMHRLSSEISDAERKKLEGFASSQGK